MVERWHEVPLNAEPTREQIQQLYDLCKGGFVINKVHGKDMFFAPQARDAVAAKLLFS